MADPVTMRVRWEEIQAANDLSDGAVGAAKDTLAAAGRTPRQVRLDKAITRSERIGSAIVLRRLALIAIVCWVTMRSVTRPVKQVKASLEALAAGDLAVPTGVTSRETRSGRWLPRWTPPRRRCGRSSPAWRTSAHAVAASSEELSASSAQIAASAGGDLRAVGRRLLGAPRR